MARFWSILIGYVFGNFLFAMIIGRLALHVDPTKYGSRNQELPIWELFLVKNGEY